LSLTHSVESVVLAVVDLAVGWELAEVEVTSSQDSWVREQVEPLVDLTSAVAAAVVSRQSTMEP
jgi:hypothetical protein